jgi:phosphatidate phosphatase LPIN
MLDAQGYKATDEDTKEFDALAKEIFREETGQGQDSLDTLIGHDQDGNLWIYASEEAKLYAESQSRDNTGSSTPVTSTQPTRPLLKALTNISQEDEGRISRAESEPAIPTMKADEGYSYAKTLRLTSEQLVFIPINGIDGEILEFDAWEEFLEF